ncbi:MAG: molecular chaperone Hsp90 [Actinomycetes bacterium]
MSSTTADPFDTAHLRSAVLDAWRSSPTRFREDANVEEDYALGAYRDRLIVELAQNASDAAKGAGVRGRLLLRADDGGLTAANVGAPLDRAGVESLAAMRASSKDAGSVGRFGVGFAATLAVSDAPEIRSRDGGVRFDRAATIDILRSDADLLTYAEQRIPPLLRLPLPTDASPEDGYDTTVVLPWRDDAARKLALDALAAIDDALLIALPHLDEILVEIRTSEGVDRRRWQVARDASPVMVSENDQTRYWRVATVIGDWADENDPTIPTEVRGRGNWSATIAIPVAENGSPVALPSGVQRVVHAPTPTDEPLDLPVLLVADLPLDPSRRRVVQGTRAAAVVGAAAKALAAAIIEMAGEHGPVVASLVPKPALVGWIDTALREGVRESLRGAQWVPAAHDGLARRPDQVVALERGSDELVRALAPHLDDLLDPAWTPHLAMLRSLGAVSRPIVEVWDVVAPLPLTPRDWHRLYAASVHLETRDLEGLPVPLTDGRVVRSVRSTMLADGHDLAILGVDVVHADAEHPLLERLGARAFTITQVLDASFVRRVVDAVEHDEDEARAIVVAAAVLLDDSAVEPGDLVSAADVPVATRDGSWVPASAVVVPGSALDAVAEVSIARLADDLVTSASVHAWAALGVLAALTPVTLHDQPLDAHVWDEVMVDGGDWCAAVADVAGTEDPGDLFAPEVVIVRGVELLDGASIVDFAELLTAPAVTRALISPTVILTGDGRRVLTPSPAAWWLSETPILDGRCPAEVRITGDDRLEPFFAVTAIPSGVDEDLLVAIGVHTTLERWVSTSGGADDLLDALADESIAVPPSLLVELMAAIAEVVEARLPDPPQRVRVIRNGTTEVVDAEDAIVAIAPHHSVVLQASYLPGTERLAEILDLAPSDDEACGASALAGTGVERPVPVVAGALALPATYREHDELVVDGVSVDWWVTDGGEVHTATLDGLARGLAWASGRWGARFELADALENQGDAVILDAERLYDR